MSAQFVLAIHSPFPHSAYLGGTAPTVLCTCAWYDGRSYKPPRSVLFRLLDDTGKTVATAALQSNQFPQFGFDGLYAGQIPLPFVQESIVRLTAELVGKFTFAKGADKQVKANTVIDVCPPGLRSDSWRPQLGPLGKIRIHLTRPEVPGPGRPPSIPIVAGDPINLAGSTWTRPWRDCYLFAVLIDVPSNYVVSDQILNGWGAGDINRPFRFSGQLRAPDRGRLKDPPVPHRIMVYALQRVGGRILESGAGRWVDVM